MRMATSSSTRRGRQSGADLKPPQAAVVKSDGGERCGKVGTRFRQARLREASASEPLQKCRKRIRRCQNRGLTHLPGRAWGMHRDCPSGIRHVGGAKLNLALVRNVRTWPAMSRDKMLWGGGEDTAFIGADVNRWSSPCRS